MRNRLEYSKLYHETQHFINNKKQVAVIIINENIDKS